MRKYWGPLYWYMLHTVANNFPQNPTSSDAALYNAFLFLFISLIPCSICKTHFTQLVKEFPINISHTQGLKKWAFDAHNMVNKKNKKKLFTMQEYETAYKTIDHVKIARFVLYVTKQVYERQMESHLLANLIVLLRSIHPCFKCRFKLNKYCKKTKFTKDMSIVHLKPLVINWFSVDRSHENTQEKPIEKIDSIVNPVATTAIITTQEALPSHDNNLPIQTVE